MGKSRLPLRWSVLIVIAAGIAVAGSAELGPVRGVLSGLGALYVMARIVE